MQKLIIIKLGGSVITDKNKRFTAKIGTIKRLSQELKDLTHDFKGKLIITHGSGSFGHYVASKYKTSEGLVNKKSLEGASLTSDAAIQINRIVMKQLLNVGLNVKSFSPASFIYSDNHKAKIISIEPIKKALNIDLIPVLYGDVVMDKGMGFCIFSAENVIAVLVDRFYKDFQISKVIYLSDTNGVYDDKGNTINRISQPNFQRIKKQITGSSSFDVTGGMLHKVDESIKLSQKYNLDIFLANGDKKGILMNIYKGKVGKDVTKIVI